MTRTEILERIAKINYEIDSEWYKDRGYDFWKVKTLENERAELEKKLTEVQ